MSSSARFNRLAPTARADLELFQRTSDLNALDRVVNAAIEAQVVPAPTTPVASLPEDTPLLDGTGLSSLDVIELVFLMEEMLDLSISNQEVVSLRTLKDLRSFVRRKAGAKRGLAVPA